SGSMFESQSSSPGENGVMTVFGTIIGNMYYTIFAVAISFLGIIVGISTIYTHQFSFRIN
ncbi:MAG: hypothetical protein UHK52_08305, partial [Bacteroidales bacterium]|nr:hypothetical protein [Bacteroidales bacterium]